MERAFPPVRWIPADDANHTVSDRPRAHPVDFVVVHVTEETFADTRRIFQDPRAKVSAHYLVGSADGRVAQFVREKDIAWHAGNWDYNTRSIGIEHEGWPDRPEYFTDALYDASARLAAAVCHRYGIPVTRDRVIGHSEVPGATHTDPGTHWDWDRYLDLVARQLICAGQSRTQGEAHMADIDIETRKAEARKAFDRFDVNGDGFITAAEYKSVMAQLGDFNVTETVAQALINKKDGNADGVLSFDEFWASLNH